jgi:hypothetical protein
LVLEIGKLITGSGETPATLIRHIESASVKCVRFEWHPETKRLYMIRLGGPLQIGEPIAYDVVTEGMAINYCQCWLRGWRERDMTITAPITVDQAEQRLVASGETP